MQPLLIKFLFEKNRSVRAVPKSQRQFWPRIAPVLVGLYLIIDMKLSQYIRGQSVLIFLYM